VPSASLLSSNIISWREEEEEEEEESKWGVGQAPRVVVVLLLLVVVVAVVVVEVETLWDCRARKLREEGEGVRASLEHGA